MSFDGPILVYDKSCRQICIANEDNVNDALHKLLLLLRTHGLERTSELLTLWAKHRLDDRQYALKVVSNIRSRRHLELARSEVCLMARLSHENIVRYVTSWVEYDFQPNPRSTPEPDSSASTSSTSETRSGSSSTCSANEVASPTSFLSNASSIGAKSQDSLTEVVNGHVSRDKFTTNSVRTQSKRARGGRELIAAPNVRPRPRMPRPALFIQMELCSYNLTQWLSERLRRLDSMATSPSLPPSSTSSTDRAGYTGPYSLVSHTPARWLADQIARAVAYLHSEQLMHRDLKPENVLLCGPTLENVCDAPCSCRPGRLLPCATSCLPSSATTSPRRTCYHQLVVKICDFGLARFLPPTRNQRYHNAETLGQNNDSHPLVKKAAASQKALPWNGTNCAHSENSSNSMTESTCSVEELMEPIGGDLSEKKQLAPLSLYPTAPWSVEHPMLTGDLGSAIYSAPEVTTVSPSMGSSKNRPRRVRYDYKADVFSMGVIFLQLFHAFHTLHELIDHLPHLSHTTRQVGRPSQIPNSHQLPSPTNMASVLACLPSALVFSWPEESLLVARMLQTDPNCRPTSTEVLEAFSTTSEFPDLLRFRTTTEPPTTTIHQSGKTTVNSLTTPPVTLPNLSDVTVEDNQPAQSHRVHDALIWRIRELEQELAATRRRLAVYEAV